MKAAMRYVVLCEGVPVFITQNKQALLAYLWGRVIRRYPGAPYRYVIFDYERPYVVDTGDVEEVIDRLPE